jgi:hypothetical protein
LKGGGDGCGCNCNNDGGCGVGECLVFLHVVCDLRTPYFASERKSFSLGAAGRAFAAATAEKVFSPPFPLVLAKTLKKKSQKVFLAAFLWIFFHPPSISSSLILAWNVAPNHKHSAALTPKSPKPPKPQVRPGNASQTNVEGEEEEEGGGGGGGG